jgi:hypothetical protein
LRRIHLGGSQEHVDLGLRIGVHPGEFHHQQLLLEVGADLKEKPLLGCTEAVAEELGGRAVSALSVWSRKLSIVRRGQSLDG